MLNKIKDDYLSWLVLIGAILLLLEVFFFNPGLIFSLFVSGSMVYFGRKLLHKVIGKVLFWAGLFFFIGSVIGMLVFRFFIVVVLIYIVFHFAQSKKKPDIIRPIIDEPAPSAGKDLLVESSPLFKNIWFGSQKTPQQAYEWNDINIVAGVGDTVVDFSYTVLPKGEAVIFIRNIVGNIKIYVPYDIEVNIHHTTMAGTADLLEYHQDRAINQQVKVKTPGYDQAEQKIKIFTSMLVGDIEVKRI